MAPGSDPSPSLEYFGNKKTIVTYVLSVLVFWIHISTFYNYPDTPLGVDLLRCFVQTASTRVAVPLFFIISGALFFRNYTPKNYLGKLKRRLHSLLIPYFCWNGIMMLFLAAATVCFSQFFIGREPFQFTWQGILEGFLHYKYNNPFWFVFALMAFALAAPVFHWLLKRKWLAFTTLGLLWLLCSLGIGLPKQLFTDPSCIVYYFVGCMIGAYYWDWFSSPSKKGPHAACFVLLIICWAYSFGWCFDLYRQTTGVSIGMNLLNSYAFWSLADIFCQRHPAKPFMAHSFWVYAMHMNVSSLITKLIYLPFPRHWLMSIPNFAATTILTLVIIELCCRFLQKHFPAVYRLLGGAR